ncbi:Ubiquitin carboxyl-terminal hydrolase 42 [Blomia tropicalis]|nr:Ubiquitin carboxyl-terminal hydrolase 42 [Blomia tropicalis]
MALISDKKFAINSSTNGNGCQNNNQFNFFSQSSLLGSHIEFKSSKEHSDDSSGDEDISNKLKSKYKVLVPDSELPNDNVKSKKLCTNGGYMLNKPRPTTTNKEINKDGNELGTPKYTLYSRDKIDLEWKKMSKIGSGLANLGNTCFMNSVLQCLTYCPPLVNYFSSQKDEHPSKCQLNFCMICLMMKHVSISFNRNNQVVKPIYICQRLKSIAKHFNFGRQEDAHEFLRYVIDHMWRSCLNIHEHEFGITGLASKFDHLTKSTTAINQIFGGYHRSQVLCLQCKEKSNTYDYFMDFMLDIQNVSSLEEALQKFVTPEILKQDNAYECGKCKKSVVAKKQFTVYRSPNVATFQFKRFDCTRLFGKISKPVSYPEKLNLRPYMSEKGPPVFYKLISVLVHFGSSSNSGHYYCYVRNSNNAWYLMDDSRVNQVSLNEVLNQKAYVLFYTRLPTVSLQESNTENKVSTSMNSNNQQQKFFSSKPESSQQVTSQSKYFNNNFKFGSNFLPSTVNGNTSTNNVNGYLDKRNLILSTSSKSNIDGNSHSNLSSLCKKPTLLVPYEKDSDDEKDDDCQSKDENDNSFSRITKNFSTSEQKQTNKISQSTSTSNSSVISNPVNGNDKSHIKNDREPLPIPILKVKATTNSWQVVESIPNTRNVEEKNAPKLHSNWKIVNSNNHGESARLNGNDSQQHSSITYSGVDSYRKSKDYDNKKERKERKEKKKKRKKDKEKLKRKIKRANDNDTDDDDTELKWVERTKETLEMENKTVPVSTTGCKRKFFKNVEENGPSNEIKHVKKDVYTIKKNDILDVLLKNVSHGYNDNVKSWNGGESSLNQSISENAHFSNLPDLDDEYNEEFDQGKEKKIKKKIDKVDLFNSKNNPFQRMHTNKYSNGSNENGNHYSGNSNIKHNKFGPKHDFNSSGKFNGGNGDMQRHSDKVNDKFGKNNHYSYNHHHHHRLNSNGSHKMRNKFKYH